MSPSGRRAVIAVATAATAVTLLCVIAARLPGGDPMAALEVAVSALVAIWLLLGARSAYRGSRAAARLGSRCRPSQVAGVECQVIVGGASEAFVLGALRPRVYVGEALLLALAADELRAVVLHEEYHRRTRAPLRSVGLEAWLALAGRWAAIRAAIDERTADLERDADRAALQAGVRPATLAAALVKADGGFRSMGVGFAARADRRLRGLLEIAVDGEDRTPARLPYEWLPIAALATIAVACQVGGSVPLS
ncbi:MAG: hypothetical protein M0Z49_07790 [Chloroflexi bacterium]|nr:hypothetical protein [Chloroflexota bacterium]